MEKKRKSFFHLRHPEGDLPIYFDELGNSLQISGMILSGNDLDILAYLPNEAGSGRIERIFPNRDEWQSILKFQDDPLILERHTNGSIKAIHRKCMRKVAGGLQWEIFYRDRFECMYCRKIGGKNGLILTVDHFLPVELGGTDTPDNLLTACRKCNKVKSDKDPRLWCDGKNTIRSYEWYIKYLEENS